jgi:hypothetical protein
MMAQLSAGYVWQGKQRVERHFSKRGLERGRKLSRDCIQIDDPIADSGRNAGITRTP